MSMPWFRMYAEFAGDPVIQSLAFEDQRHYIVLLCLKCNGTLDRDIATKMRDMIIYRGLGLDAPSAEEAKRRLMEVGIINKNWQPLGWEKRQYTSDVSTERVRKHRNEKQLGNVTGNTEKRFGNGPDTEQIQNRTDTETTSALTRTSTPEEEIPPGLDLTAWVRWQEYKKQIRKPLKPVSIPAAQRKLAAFGSDQMAVVEQSIANGYQGLFPVNDRRKSGRRTFEDYRRNITEKANEPIQSTAKRVE